jgi:uncharacterized membrane protein
MRTALVVALIATAAFMGCKKSEEGGRAGSDTFRLSVSALSTNINQGETQIVRVTVERGEGFQQSVKLETKAPTGLQVEIKNALVKPGDKGDVQVLVTAAKDAPLGEQKILVKGTPDKGDPAEIEFRVVVRAGDGTAGAGTSKGGTFKIELPLAVPLLPEAIKQGETKVVTISLKRSDDFKQDVKLEMKGSAKGISLDLAQTTVKASDKPEVLLRVTADKDAALGEYQVFIKGIPETGEQVSADFKVKVVAP